MARQLDRDAFAGEQELREAERIVNAESVTGHAIFDGSGNISDKSGVSDMTVAVFSSILDHSEWIGTALGEQDPKPVVMFTSKLMELLALPMRKSNVLIVKDRTAGAMTDAV